MQCWCWTTTRNNIAWVKPRLNGNGRAKAVELIAIGAFCCGIDGHWSNVIIESMTSGLVLLLKGIVCPSNRYAEGSRHEGFCCFWPKILFSKCISNLMGRM
jgi:hypothetical protein